MHSKAVFVPWVFALSLCVSIFARPLRAAAQEDETEDAEARMHFRVGRAYYDSGRFEEAAREFRAAYELSQRPALLHNLFVAYRDAGNLAEAIPALREYLRLVPEAPEREQLAARLASMERLHRDREQVAVVEVAVAAPAPSEEPAPSGGFETWWPGWILGGVGAAAALASIGTGVAALDARAELDRTCTAAGACPAGFQDARDRGALLAGVTDALLLGGIAVAAAGTILALAVPSAAARGPTAALSCDGSGCVGVVSGSF